MTPLCAMLHRQARERTAIVSDGESLSFGELNRRIEARALDGVRPGDLVALATGNSAAFVEFVFALRARGAVVLPGATREVARRLGARWFIGPALERIGEGRALLDGAAFVKLTSGSTTAPRGAIFTEDALVEGIAHIRDGMGLTRDDVVLIAIPLSHSYGFDNGVLSLAAIGTPLVIQTDVLPGALRASIAQNRVTFFPAVPALLRALTPGGAPIPSLRSVISASAPLSPDVADAFADAYGVRVRDFFGATEAGGITFDGVPLPGVRIELVDGCVHVHSKANRFAILTEAGVEDAPGPVETGDRAEFTPDGRLKLLGRTVHVANVCGVKVDLAAIEAFFRSVEGVSDAAAMAIDDPARGQRVVVCVETQSRSAEELRAIAPREAPRDIRIVPRLPRTERGKLDRPALREIVRA